MRIVKLTKETTENILENMLKRSPTQYGTYEASVQEIIENVKTRKDHRMKNSYLNHSHTFSIEI